MDTKTERFASELRTATEVQRVAREHGTSLTIEQAHEAWAEHSDDYCAQWLCWRDENPRIEILQALTKYRERHAKTAHTGKHTISCSCNSIASAEADESRIFTTTSTTTATS